MAALSLSATGAIAASSERTDAAPSSALSNAAASASSPSPDAAEITRAPVVSRDSDREQTARAQQLDAAATRKAAAREQELNQLASQAAAYGQYLKDNQWVLPLPEGSFRISEGYGEGSEWRGYAHGGLDMAAPGATPIYAVTSGVITFAGYAGACGNMTIQRLDDGSELKYCHQSRLATSVGARVGPGDVIGYVGTTGRSTGNHLHLEVDTPSGAGADPYSTLTTNGVTF